MDAFGLEEGDNGVDGGEGSGAEGRVEGEGFPGIDSHDFEADDFFFEFGGEFVVGGGVEWVAVEEAAGFWG